jgi:hypothetical protein
MRRIMPTVSRALEDFGADLHTRRPVTEYALSLGCRVRFRSARGSKLDRRSRGARGIAAPGRGEGHKFYRGTSIHPPSDDRVVDYQYDYRPDDRNHQAVKVEAGDPTLAKHRKDEPSDHGPHNSEHDVEENPRPSC